MNERPKAPKTHPHTIFTVVLICIFIGLCFYVIA